MFPEVWNRVVRGSYASRPARLDDYRRYALLDLPYPAIVAAAGASVEGVLYLGVDDADLARLDAFEGSEYRRDALPVSTRSGPMPAQAYVWLDTARLSGQPWLPESFSIPQFLGTYAPARDLG
jgi:hypothetical protein